MISDGATIVACATGIQTPVAMAVVRVSGFASLEAFQDLFSRPIADLAPRQMVRANLIDRETVVDDVCLCFFKAPHSYTGENLLELYVHGNPLNVRRILALFERKPGVRGAKPGEFSLRALQNGKMTLSQVEGLDLLLNASSPLALKQGMGLLQGELHHAYLALLDAYKRHKASLELLLDFHEDVGEEVGRAQLNASWNEVWELLSSLKRRLDPESSRLLRPEIVLAGQPNAGKSTLFNLLLGEERAITSPTAGTTRDYIAEDVQIGDVVYRLVDTAGLRGTEDAIEARGIVFTRQRLARAFFSVLLVNPFETNVDEIKPLLQHPFDVVWVTHQDRPGFQTKLQELEAAGVVLWGHTPKALIHECNIGELENEINKKYLDKSCQAPLLLDRHKEVISASYSIASSYHNIRQSESDIAILSNELNALGHCLQELLGIVSTDEVLDHIFAHFCIGK